MTQTEIGLTVAVICLVIVCVVMWLVMICSPPNRPMDQWVENRLLEAKVKTLKRRLREARRPEVIRSDTRHFEKVRAR